MRFQSKMGLSGDHNTLWLLFKKKIFRSCKLCQYSPDPCQLLPFSLLYYLTIYIFTDTIGIIQRPKQSKVIMHKNRCLILCSMYRFGYRSMWQICVCRIDTYVRLIRQSSSWSDRIRDISTHFEIHREKSKRGFMPLYTLK